MSASLQNASRVPTADGVQDLYDHEINLVDTTAPDTATSTRTESPTGSSRRLGRIPTRTSLKKSLVRRKYAKYQENRYSKSSTVDENEVTEDFEPSPAQTSINGESQTVDFAQAQEDRGRKHKAPEKQKSVKRQYEIDVLYENQRGSFFFGIPLYSHSSLLNFDPSPWMTRDFKDSPVNITNAQVPDPSWEWSWKTWYVDMSYDVDEEGWQYSFSFGKNFSWHGTHPWIHSFVRRRRWLRKRVRRPHYQPGAPLASSLSAAHQLTAEYFTIHPKRDRSPDSFRPHSYMTYNETEMTDEPPEEVKDIATLLKGLRMASIDREKLDLVRKFMEQGGEELAYLGPHIPEIMSFLVFQNSRRQLLAHLKKTVDEAQAQRDEQEAEDRPEGYEESKRLDALLQAVDEADRGIVDLEYWSDRKHILRTIDADPNAEITQAIATIFDAPAPMPKADDNPAGNIKGISSSAEVGRDPTREVARAATRGPNRSVERRQPEGGEKGKGKERRRDSEDDEIEDASPPRLKHDQVMIADD